MVQVHFWYLKFVKGALVFHYMFSHVNSPRAFEFWNDWSLCHFSYKIRLRIQKLKVALVLWMVHKDKDSENWTPLENMPLKNVLACKNSTIYTGQLMKAITVAVHRRQLMFLSDCELLPMLFYDRNESKTTLLLAVSSFLLWTLCFLKRKGARSWSFFRKGLFFKRNTMKLITLEPPRRKAGQTGAGSQNTEPKVISQSHGVHVLTSGVLLV